MINLNKLLITTTAFLMVAIPVFASPSVEKSTTRAVKAKEHVSVVSQKVQELLANRTTQGGIGQQVRVIAQQQNQAQEQVKEKLEKMESKGKVSKKLFGPDYKAIREMKQLTEQNAVRIQQLEQLKTQVTDESAQKQIPEVIDALKEQNTALTEQVTAEEKTGSLFGWLMKSFSK